MPDAIAKDAMPIQQQEDAAAPSARASEPMSRRTKVALVAVGASVGVLAILGVAGAITASALNSGPRGPEAAALEYAQAIADGDASRANELVDPNVPADRRDLLTDAALGAAVERIEVTGTTLMSSRDGIATVVVDYRLGGVAGTQDIVLEQVDSTALVLDNWQIVTPFVSTSTIGAESFQTLEVAGVEVALDEAAYGNVVTAEIAAYPGIYLVEAPSTEYLETQPQNLRIEPTAVNDPVLMTATPTDALADEIQRQVEAVVQDCIARGEPDADDCPFSAYVSGDAPDFAWTLITMPTVEVNADGTFDFDDGEVAYAYTYDIGFGLSPFARDGERDVFGGGTYTIDGDTITAEIDQSWW